MNRQGNSHNQVWDLSSSHTLLLTLFSAFFKKEIYLPIFIRLGLVQAFGLGDGKVCDSLGRIHCDPFAKIYIDGDYKNKTSPRADTPLFDFNYEYTTPGPIRKDSKIKIEIWDDDDAGEWLEAIKGVFTSNGKQDLILETEGTIQSFIEQPQRRSGPRVIQKFNAMNHFNTLNTYIFWEPIYTIKEKEPVKPATKKSSLFKRKTRS